MFRGGSGSRAAVGWRTRAAAGLGALAIGAAAAVAAAVPAAAAEQTVDDATLTWGLSGYAQKDVFGAWTFKDLTGGTTLLTGSVSGGDQSEYLVDPVPATSFPPDASFAGKTPNAVKFTGGTGTADPATGAATLAWEGSYTVNAYPAGFNAPNEIYADPQLEVAADGSGALSFDFTLGAGVDLSGNPSDAVALGRVTLLTFSPGSVDVTGEGQVRLTPDYQGVAVTLPDGGTQTTSCGTDGGATGWWGSWAQAFISVVPASVRPHFYSTGCGGMQDLKPALPLDVSYTVDAGEVAVPQVVVTPTTLDADGTTDLTVTGTGFVAGADGTAPGLYVAVGPKIGDTWYLNAAPFQFAKYVRTGFTGDETASGATLEADGSFVVHFTDVQPLYTKSGTTYNAADTQFSVLTFAAQGNAYRGLDTVTPLTFTDPDGLPVQVEIPQAPPEPGEFAWTIDGGLSAVSLGTAASTPSGFTASGALRTITVQDTRLEAPAWAISGRVGNFTTGDGATSFGGQALGWTPALSDNTVSAVEGAPVAPGTDALDGLKSSRTLASAPAGHDLGSVDVDAALSLLAPAETEPGSYTAVLTLTALS